MKFVKIIKLLSLEKCQSADNKIFSPVFNVTSKLYHTENPKVLRGQKVHYKPPHMSNRLKWFR